MRKFLLGALALAAACGGGAAPSVQTHSGPLALSSDGKFLFVAHPDADRVSVIETASQKIAAEIPLGAAGAPARDPATGRYDPAVLPRALAIDPAGKTLYVTGERSGHLYAIDVASKTVINDVPVCAEPIGVLSSFNGTAIFVACSQDDEILQLTPPALAIAQTAKVPRKPWALALSSDGGTLYATHFLGAGVSALATSPLALSTTYAIADGPAGSDATEPHGPARGLYDVAERPGTRELWTAHLMLGIDTAQPTLDFLRTVFPALTILDGSGTQLARLSVEANPGDGGAFGDIVSGPRALAFSPDGKFLAIADADSEDLLVVDAAKRIETQIVRPLPGHLPEGVVWAPNGKIYLHERNSEELVVFSAIESQSGVSVTMEANFPSLALDPMPADLRLGQKLFYSANSDDVPVTQNHWVACASCHLEGRSDAVTWKFAQGPRDTPTNAGGTRDTGFLFRTADRNQVQDYWKTIDVEQGGHFSLDTASQQPLLDALAAFVDDAIPAPSPPATDDNLRARGQAVFASAGCASCHAGPAYTDSGAGNPTLDMEGTVLLHDVGTCVTSGYPDVAHQDKDGNLRAACEFDTPSLRGLWDSAPYLHDGSAATLDDVLTGRAAAAMGAANLSSDDRAALVEFLKSL